MADLRRIQSYVRSFDWKLTEQPVIKGRKYQKAILHGLKAVVSYQPFTARPRPALSKPTFHLVLLRRTRPAGLGDLVDDPLDEHHVDVDVAGQVGQKLGDEVVDRRGGQGDAVTRGAGGEAGLLA